MTPLKSQKRVPYTPRAHQGIAIKALKENPFFALILDMGLGKSSITATVIKFLLDCIEVHTPLIIAPKLVSEHTWPTELGKWEHLKGLTYSVIAGTESQRLAAYFKPADIYIIGVANFEWLTKIDRKWKFDMVVIDESSKFKSRDTNRWKAMRGIRPSLDRLVLLTGTPTPNGLMDLWSQIYLLDQGQRLFKFIESYRATYFSPLKKLNYGGFKYGINPGAEEIIFEKIKDICLCMRKRDWIDMPERTDIIREVELDNYDEYQKFKKQKILELPGGEITAFTASALYSKLLQYANGAVYDVDHKYHIVHDKKLDMLEEMVEELQGNPVLIFYQFQSDLERIQQRMPFVQLLKGSKPSLIDQWNAGEVPAMIGHAASIGHGLNLQFGGHYVIWYGVGDNQEWYSQGIERIDRPGQEFPVFNYHILVKGTPEHKVYNSLVAKTLTQDRLFEALKA